MSSAGEPDGLEALEAEIDEDLGAEADEHGRTGRAVRNINWNVIYLGAGALLLVLLTVAFVQTSGDKRQVPRQTGAAERDTRTPSPAEPPYREAARERSQPAAGDTLASAPAVPPKSSAVVGGGEGGRDYREVQSGAPAGGGGGAPSPGDSARGGIGSAGVQGGGQERPRDPRREAWAAARDEVPEPGWGTVGAGNGFQRSGEAAETEAPGQEPGAGEPPAADESVLREAETAFGLAPGTLSGGQGGSRPAPVAGGLVVPAMTPIPAVLVTGITSESTGDVIAQVTQDVRDRSGTQTAIPRGSWVSGRLARPPVPGDARVDISWNLLRYPDRATVPLPGLGTADRKGAGGVPARVDTHYGPALLTAVAGSVLGGGLQLAQARQGGGQAAPTAGQVAAGVAGQQMAQVGGDLVNRGAGIRSTATVAPATRILILVREDLSLPPRAR
ncbi:MAG TPA: TrbI/VirB10 family protein [Longimicrobiaceae bacterium]